MNEQITSVIEPICNKWTGTDAQHKPSVFRHKLAMFLTGFIMLTPHRIAILCAPYIVKRFHLPPSVVPLFIYKIHNPMELASLIGTTIQVVLTVIITAICNQTGTKGLFGVNNKIGAYDYSGNKWNDPANADENTSITQLKALFSIIIAWIMFSTSILTYIFFITGGDYGYFNKFFWSVIFNAFANGMYSSISFSVNTNAAIYAVGLPLSGFFTFVFHNCCKYLSNRFNWEDYDYTRVQLQIIFTILILFITAGCWTFDQVCQIYGDPGVAKGSSTDKVAATLPGQTSFGELFDTTNSQGIRHWSPILMLGSSLGSVYAFYPAITPYMLMYIDEANDLDQWIQFISSIPTLVIGFLDEFNLGPGGISAGTWGEFIANDKTNYKDIVLSKLDDAEGNIKTAITALGTDRTAQANKAKLSTVKGKIDIAKQRVNAITTGAEFKDTASGKGKQAVDALDAVNSTATDQITTADFNTGGTITATDITTPITAAKSKFETAETNGVGHYANPNKAHPNTANNWNIGGNGRWYWNPIGWGPFIPYILCLHIFITMLHFPNGLIATFLHSKQWLLKCICISFNFWQEIMEIIGFAGAGKQSNKSGYAMVYNSSVGTFNNFFFFFVMINCMFTGDGQK